MADNFTLAPAFSVSVDDRKEVDVRVSFESGKPSSVAFFDSDRDAMVSVPFDLWQRVVSAVDRTVDMNQVA